MVFVIKTKDGNLINDRTMKRNIKLFIGLLTMAAAFVSCDNDATEKLSFDVNTPDITINEGEKVNFNFYGNPNYLTFYSGEEGNMFENKNRTNKAIDNVYVSFTTSQQYGSQKNKLKVWMSENFNGDYSEAGIQKATWTELTSEFVLPNGGQTNIQSGRKDFSKYKDSKFFFAFEYLPDAGSVEPKITISPIRLITKLGNTETENTNVTSSFGFSMVAIKGGTGTGVSMKADKSSIIFQGGDGKVDNHIWMISKPIDASAIEPDYGVAIKNMSAKIETYSYVYNKAGEYNATFVATNANKWNSESTTRQIKITVKAK